LAGEEKEFLTLFYNILLNSITIYSK